MENALYSSLPREILDVADRIGLTPGISKSEDVIQTYVHDRVPRKDAGDDFKYKVYTLYEVIEENKPAAKKLSGKESEKRLNCRQKKALFDIKSETFNYGDFVEVNQLWNSYFASLVAEVKCKPDELKLARADYHGAHLMVTASKNPTVIGLKGFVVQESKHTFRMLNEKNRLLTIPKNGTVFTFEHNKKTYRLNAYNMMMSSFNRSKMKPKFNFIPEL